MHISGGYPKRIKPTPKKSQTSGIIVERERRKWRRSKVEEDAGWVNTEEGSVLTSSEDDYPVTPWHQEFPSDGEEDEEINESSNDGYRKRQVRTYSTGSAIASVGSTETVVDNPQPESGSTTDEGKAPPKTSNPTSEVPGFYFTDAYEGDIVSGRYLSKSAIEGQMNFEFAVTGRRQFNIVQVLGEGTRIYVHYEYDRTGHLHATRQLQVVREYPSEPEVTDSDNDSYEPDDTSENSTPTDNISSGGDGNPNGQEENQPQPEYGEFEPTYYVVLNPGTEDEEVKYFESEEEKQDYIDQLQRAGWTEEEPSSSGDDWESSVWGEDGELAEGWDDIPEADDSFWSESGLG